MIPKRTDSQLDNREALNVCFRSEKTLNSVFQADIVQKVIWKNFYGRIRTLFGPKAWDDVTETSEMLLHCNTTKTWKPVTASNVSVRVSREPRNLFFFA